MGFYMPAVFHEQGQWMSPGIELPPDVQEHLQQLWHNAEENIRASIEHMDLVVKAAGFRKGLAKEEGGRLLPSSKLVKGLLTATEDAWYCFLVLRNSFKADGAMRILAEELQAQMVEATWTISDYHVPYSPEPVLSDTDYHLYAMSAAARLARVSAGAPGPGQRSDGDLARDLLADKHLSPFEHVAHFERLPFPSAVCSKAEDYDTYGYGWSNLRAVIERWGPKKTQDEFVF
jgi:predicted transcriptional regulator